MDEPLVVDAATVMRRAGLTEEFMDDVVDAIMDAQADVQGHIERPLFPVERVVEGLTAADAYALTDVRAWPQVTSVEDYEVKSYTARPDGYFDVTFKVGFEASDHPPIKRFITAHALEALRNNPRLEHVIRRPVASVSADGQSLSFVTGSTAEGAAGSVPNIKTLSQYRKVLAYRPHHMYPSVIQLWPR